MDSTFVTTTVISIISAAGAVASAYVAKKALDIARDSLQTTTDASNAALRLSQDIFKRQHVIDLHLAWNNARLLDPEYFDEASYATEIVAAGNLLGLTATYWNHDVVDKEIMFGNYWESFNAYVKLLKDNDTLIPGTGKRAKDFLTDDILSAHIDMEKKDVTRKKIRLNEVSRTTVGD